jgi:hypothetical protein
MSDRTAKKPAPRKLVIGGETICEEGELLTPDEFGERVGRALRKAAGISDAQRARVKVQGWAGDAVAEEKRPAAERLVVAGIVVCEKGELVTAEDLSVRIERALARGAAGHLS